MEYVQKIDEFGYDENGINLVLLDQEKDKFTPVTATTIRKTVKRMDKLCKGKNYPTKKLLDYCLKEKMLEDRSLNEIISNLSEKYCRSENKMRSYVRNNLAAVDSVDKEYKNIRLKEIYIEKTNELDDVEKKIDIEINEKERKIENLNLLITKTKEYLKDANKGENNKK